MPKASTRVMIFKFLIIITIMSLRWVQNHKRSWFDPLINRHFKMTWMSKTLHRCFRKWNPALPGEFPVCPESLRACSSRTGLPRIPMGREEHLVRVCVPVSFFKGVTWQPDSNYKMAGVGFGVAKARSQRRWGAGQKQLRFKRHACRLFSVSGCKQICSTMHQDSPLHCSHPNSQLNQEDIPETLSLSLMNMN